MIYAEVLDRCRKYRKAYDDKVAYRKTRKLITKSFKDDMLKHPNKHGWKMVYRNEYYDERCKIVLSLIKSIFTSKKGYTIVYQAENDKGYCIVYVIMTKYIEHNDLENLPLSELDLYYHSISYFFDYFKEDE
jgi:hypothetical protein